MRLIALEKVEERIDLGKTAIYKRIRVGCFPRPVKLGSATVRWVEHEVDQWLADRIAERDTARSA